MRRIYKVLIVVISLGISCLNCSATDTERRASAASALAGQFETIFYSSTVSLSGQASTGQVSKTATLGLHYPFEYLNLAIAGLPDKFFSRVLNDSVGVFVGAKEFRPPQGSSGLGSVLSHRCYVVLLRDGSKFDLKQHFRTDLAAALVNGPVWKWAVHIDEFGPEHIGRMPAGKPRLSQLFATQVGRQYILISNNLKELRDVANELVSGNQKLENLTRIHDWGTISQYDVWGYRRYRYSGVISKVAAAMEDVEPGTEAVACFLDSQKKTLTVQLFINTVQGERTVERMNTRNNFPPLIQSRKGLWASSILLSGDNKSDEAVLVIVGLFGFRIYS